MDYDRSVTDERIEEIVEMLKELSPSGIKRAMYEGMTLRQARHVHACVMRLGSPMPGHEFIPEMMLHIEEVVEALS